MPAASTTGGTSVASVAITACCAVPPLSLRSTARAYWMKKCSSAARHWNARHCSRPSAARIAMTFIRGISTLELVAVAELLERLGIRERLDILDRQAVHDVAHR